MSTTYEGTGEPNLNLFYFLYHRLYGTVKYFEVNIDGTPADVVATDFEGDRQVNISAYNSVGTHTLRMIWDDGGEWGYSQAFDDVLITDVVTIYDNQFNNTDPSSGDYACYPSPYAGDDIVTTGIVVAIYQTDETHPWRDYYIQDCVTSTEWNGVLVFDTMFTEGMALGDNVTLKANVTEYKGGTELVGVTSLVTNSTGNALCTLTITSDDLGDCDPIAGVGENLEGMLVKLENATIVRVLTGGVAWAKTAGATDSCELDDDIFRYGTDQPEPWELGATYDYIIGMVNDAYGNYEIHPRFASDVAELGYPYLPGDANMDGKNTGPDVTYLVQYFRMANAGCKIDGYFASGDANGDCLVTGPDVTFMVQFFRMAHPTLKFCPDWQPLWPTPGDVPSPLPEGFPFCDPPVLTGKTIIPTSSPE